MADSLLFGKPSWDGSGLANKSYTRMKKLAKEKNTLAYDNHNWFRHKH